MKHMFVIFYLVMLTITIKNIHSTNTKTEVNSGLKTKVESKTKVNTKVTSKLNLNMKMGTLKKYRMDMDTDTDTDTESQSYSMMGYLNNLSKSEEYSSPQAETLKRVLNKNKKKTIIVHPKNPDVIVEHEHTLDLVKEGWLKVSTPQFKNINRFPKITLPDDTQHEIPTERDYFRINEGFDPANNPESAPSPFYFWGRLSYRNLYYALSHNSINVVGTIPVDDIQTANVLKDFARSKNCFNVFDYTKRDWVLCAENINERNSWVCKIRALKKIESEQVCIKKLIADEAIVVEKKVTQPIILIPLASPMCNENFDYEQNGRDWVCDCKEGREQSPLDLPAKEQAIKSPVKPIFEYHEVQHKEILTTIDGALKSRENLKIEVDNHALKIRHDNFGRIVTLDGSLYTAQEIVFHTPAEHSINGKKYDMEMQIIHFGQTTGDIARQVILCFVFEKKPGFYNKFIDDIDFFTLPNPLTKSRDLDNNIFIPKIFYNAKEDDVPIMKPFSFYTYQGSLTAPPCTERTIVYVASEPIKLGTTAIQLFEEALRFPDMMAIPSRDVHVSNSITFNNRAIQNRNGRNIFYYEDDEDCIEKPKGKPRKQGHFERLDKEMTQYYFVSGPKPSGMPGAFVVSKNEAVGKGLLTP